MNYYIRTLIFITLFLAGIIATEAQTKKTEALKHRLKTAVNTDRVNTLNELCWEYRLTDRTKALEYGNQALQLADKLKFNSGSATSYVNMAYIYVHECKPDSAKELYNKAIAIYNNFTGTRKGRLGAARIYEGLGLISYKEKDYATALVYYNKALAIYKDMSVHKNISVCYRIIGMIYEKTGDKDRANKNYYSEMKNTIRAKDTNTLSSINDFEKIDE
jgi:tetratricopeptide (TPR) repeat protein